MAGRYAQQQTHGTYQYNEHPQNWNSSNNINSSQTGYDCQQERDYNAQRSNDYDARNKQLFSNSHNQQHQQQFREQQPHNHYYFDGLTNTQQEMQQLNINDNRGYDSSQRFQSSSQSMNMQVSNNYSCSYEPDDHKRNARGGSSRGPIHQQRDPPEQYEESKPRVLAKKTNDAIPVAMFGVVAKVNQSPQYSTTNNNASYRGQRSPGGPQSPQSYQMSQQNNSSQPTELNRNRHPPIPRKPQVVPPAQQNQNQSADKHSRSEMSYVDESSGYGSGHTDGGYENRGNIHPQAYPGNESRGKALPTTSVQRGSYVPAHSNTSQHSNNNLSRHWTLRKPSQGDEENSQRNSAVDDTQSRSVNSIKKQFDQGSQYRPPVPSNKPALGNRFPPENSSSYGNVGNQRAYGNSRPVPPRPVPSGHQKENYGPSPDQSRGYNERNRIDDTEQSFQRKQFSHGPQSQTNSSQPYYSSSQSYQQPQNSARPPHSPNNSYGNKHPSNYNEQRHEFHNAQPETTYYDSKPQSAYERPRSYQELQYQSHYYDDGRNVHPDRCDLSQNNQFNDNVRVRSNEFASDQLHYARDQNQREGFNGSRPNEQYQTNYHPGEPYRQSERQFIDSDGSLSVANHGILKSPREFTNEQKHQVRTQEEESEINFVPDVVSRSYQMSEQHSENIQILQTEQRRTNHPSNVSASEEHSANLPEPQTRQVPMGGPSKRPPPLPHVPRHPFDPVEDDTSSENNIDESPPPVSKPGWSHRRIGGFSYLGALGQGNPSNSKSADKPRKVKQQILRQPGDGLNSDESPNEPAQVFPDGDGDQQANPLNHNHSKDRLRLAKGGRAKRRPPTRSFSSERRIQQEPSATSPNPDFEITVTVDDLAQSRTSPITVQKSKVTKSKPEQTKKAKSNKPKSKQRFTDDATQTTSSASVKTHEKLEKKFVFKVPSEDVLKRDTAHPVPCTKRVPVIEGFGNTPKSKHSFGSGLIGQLKSVEQALRPPVSKRGEKPRPPPKPSADEIRIEKNAEAIIKSIEKIDDDSRAREYHENSRQRSKDRGRSKSRRRSLSPPRRGRSKSLDKLMGAHQRGRSRSLDRLSSSHRRARSRSRDRLSSPNRRGRSGSRDRLSSPHRLGRSRSRDRLSSPHRRGRSRSRDKLSSPHQPGRSRSRDRLSSPHRRGRSRSRDRLSSPHRRGRSRSRDRLSSLHRRDRLRSRDRLSSPRRRSRSRSRDRLSSSHRRGRSRSRDRLSSPHRRGRSRSRDRLSSPHRRGRSRSLGRRGRSRSRDRLSSPSRRGRSKSRGRLSSPYRRARTRSRDRLSGPGRRGRSYSRDRYVTPERDWEREHSYRKSQRNRRYAFEYSPHGSASHGTEDTYYSQYGGDLARSRRNRPSSGGQVTKRAWVNDPRWRQNKTQQMEFSRQRDFGPNEYMERQQMFPSKLMAKNYSPSYASRNPPYNRR